MRRGRVFEENRRVCVWGAWEESRASDGGFFGPRASLAWSLHLPGDLGAALFLPSASPFEQPHKLFPWYHEKLYTGYMSDDPYSVIQLPLPAKNSSREPLTDLQKVYQIPQRTVRILTVDKCNPDHSRNAQSFTNRVTQMCQKLSAPEGQAD